MGDEFYYRNKFYIMHVCVCARARVRVRARARAHLYMHIYSLHTEGYTHIQPSNQGALTLDEKC